MTTPKKQKIESSKDTAKKLLNLAITKHLKIRKTQREISIIISDDLPSKVTNVYWIFASKLKSDSNKPTSNCGKWLIFVSIKNVDTVWRYIKVATQNGVLGFASKVATSKPNPNAKRADLKVICVYTYDSTDKIDVMRVREQLRELGVKNKIPYKTDDSTRQGKYEIKGDTNISLYME